MTDPSQYFKGRTVQEQMTEVIGYVDTRAAEVATDAIASDVAQVHQDMLDADADASAAAASAAAAAGTLANAVKKTGESSQSIAGDIAISGDLTAGGDVGVTGDAGVQGQLSVLGGCDLRAPVKIPVAPVNNDDAASKKYVDDHHDATKISITDINSYAVGLTGNQGPIAGTKTFSGAIESTAYEAFKINKAAGSPAMVGNAAATQQIIDQYANTQDGSDWMVRNTIYQSGNTKNYSRLLYLRRLDASDNIIQAVFTFSVDANGKGHISVTDNDGTIHQVI